MVCDAIFFLIQRFVFPYQLSSLLLGQHFLLTSPEENVTYFWRKRIFGNRLLSTLLQIFDEPWTRPWSCQWSKDNPSMPSWTKLALISENIIWTPKSHGYNQTPGSTASGAATISSPNFRQWLNNGSKVQPSTSGISAVPSNQYFYRASPTHTTRKNTNPEISRVTSVITSLHHLEIFLEKSLQFTRNAVIRVNARNRLLLNVIWISVFLGIMTIVQLLSKYKFTLNHLTIDKHLPPTKSQRILPMAINGH